jgi:hypothetical protein
MNKLNKIILLLVLFITAACQDNVLDTYMKTTKNLDDVLNSGSAGVIGNGMAAYAYLRNWTSLNSNAMLASACDEADFAVRGATVQQFNTGGWNQFNNPDEVMAWYYRGIVQTFNFLENSKDYVNLIAIDTLSVQAKRTYIKDCDNIYRLRAENHFLRALFYFELVKRYGGVPILNHVLAVDATQLPQRNTSDECFQYIVNELDSAYNGMADSWYNYDVPATNPTIGSGKGGLGVDVTRLGRAEKVAAKAYKLRVLLYAASPLFNPTNDITKWEKAAAAGNDFLNDPTLEPWRYLWKTYSQLFYPGSSTDLLTSKKGSNSGIIFTKPAPNYQTNTFEKWNYPISIPGGGTAITAPSQNLVDAYEMKTTGLLPYNEDGTVNTASGYDVNNPYKNRDPRLSFTIGVNGDLFGKDVGGVYHKIQSYVGGSDAVGVKLNATTTGYYLKKMIALNFDISSTTTAVRSFVLMRYAEVLLNYAEAMNEAYGPTAKPTINGVPAKYTAVEAVNLVRGRTGVAMPALPNTLSQVDMRTRIQNERRVELAFEEQRFFDVRRWKIAEITENKPLMGMLVTPTDMTNTTFTYTKFKVEDRTFDKNKMYLYPITQGQISINNWIQNPGW